MEKKQHKNGGYYLKQKIAKLEAENAALKEAVSNDPVNYKALSGQYAKQIKELEEKYNRDLKEYKTEVHEHQILEEKYKQLKDELSDKDASYIRLKNELNKTIDEQRKEIEKQTIAKESAENLSKFYESTAKKYWEAMGVIRQWWYARTKM